MTSDVLKPGTWVVTLREKDGKWFAHRLRNPLRVSLYERTDFYAQLDRIYGKFRSIELCGWQALETENPEYPVLVYDEKRTHYFPFPCANDPHRYMGSMPLQPLPS